MSFQIYRVLDETFEQDLPPRKSSPKKKKKIN